MLLGSYRVASFVVVLALVLNVVGLFIILWAQGQTIWAVKGDEIRRDLRSLRAAARRTRRRAVAWIRRVLHIGRRGVTVTASATLPVHAAVHANVMLVPEPGAPLDEQVAYIRQAVQNLTTATSQLRTRQDKVTQDLHRLRAEFIAGDQETVQLAIGTLSWQILGGALVLAGTGINIAGAIG